MYLLSFLGTVIASKPMSQPIAIPSMSQPINITPPKATYTPSAPVSIPRAMDALSMGILSSSVPSASPMMTPPTTFDDSGRQIQIKKNKFAHASSL
jgi:hypothetical protein